MILLPGYCKATRMCVKVSHLLWCCQGDGSCQILKSSSESPFATLEWEALQARTRNVQEFWRWLDFRKIAVCIPSEWGDFRLM